MVVGHSHVLMCVAKRWHKHIAPVSPLQLEPSTKVHTSATSALCECARGSQTGPIQSKTATQVPLLTGEA